VSSQPETLFDSVESAHEYVQLLRDVIRDAKQDIAADVATAATNGARRLDALRLVEYKLGKLEQHLQSSSRLLNDLRTLRRLLLEERFETAAAVRARTGTEG
jgi:hypothetical protein